MATVIFEEKLTLKNTRGLHARAASKFVRMAKKFAADVKVSKGAMRVDGKSIMGLMLLAAPKETELKVSCEGPEAELAMAAIRELVKGKFGED